MKKQTNQLQYGNWVSDKLISKTLIVFTFFMITSILLFVLPFSSFYVLIVLRVISLVFVTLLLVAIIYFLKAKQILSYTGGNLQSKVLDELITKVQWSGEGKALDIGCGSGALTIKLADKFKNAKITGIDYWGNEWDYCKTQCEMNAKIMKVNENIDFLKASASNLPFDDEAFDLVVSNMTFHEVSECKNKLDPIREALRVLKENGTFVFQDLFKLKSYYGTPEVLLANIKNMGVSEIKFIDTSQISFIPKMMKLPFMLGAAGIVYGTK